MEQIYFQIQSTDVITGKREGLVSKIIGSELYGVNFLLPEMSLVAEYLTSPPTIPDYIIKGNSEICNLAEKVGALVYKTEKSEHGLSLERLQKLKVLDLGCGSDFSLDSKSTKFSPDFCRDLYNHGIYVTGVDNFFPKYDSDNKGVTEKWEFKQANLANENSLSIFENSSYDVVRANMLIADGRSINKSPALFCHDENFFFKEALRILKTGGVFITTDYVYQKKTEVVTHSFACLNDTTRKKDITLFDNSLIVDS